MDTDEEEIKDREWDREIMGIGGLERREEEVEEKDKREGIIYRSIGWQN